MERAGEYWGRGIFIFYLTAQSTLYYRVTSNKEVNQSSSRTGPGKYPQSPHAPEEPPGPFALVLESPLKSNEPERGIE
jgi:hypothetical protein